MNRTTIDFGIDLGTTNSTIAVIDEIDARVIPNKVGSGITPSAFWIDKRGNSHVGEEAKQRALVDDRENADLEFKLRMGSGEEARKTFARSGRSLLPEELSAEVLKSLKTDVQTSMGEDIRSAVITVPAAFENPQISATQRAAQLAGLGVVPICLEPVAASLAYGFQSESDNAYWLVYDFGGGTFDAAVMRIRDGLLQVVNHDGDNALGGKLIDWDIVTQCLAPVLSSQFNLPDFRLGNTRWDAVFGKLKWHAEKAKIEVCRTRKPSEIWIENLCEDADGKTLDFSCMLTPEHVQSVSSPHIARSLALCRSTLKKSGLTGGNMDRILMVGGSTLNPWVRDAVQAELSAKLEFGIDPVTVVARGAAIFASTQSIASASRDKGDSSKPLKTGTCTIEIEHTPVGNVADPDIGGRVRAPDERSTEGFTLEIVDTKTRWRSGKVRLGADGVFMTQLYAEKQKRHEYEIELCDATGSRVPCDPDHLNYTLGVIPAAPPAAATIGVGLANGSVAAYITKGTALPFRKSLDHYTAVHLHAGKAEDVLRIPLLEGEHSRAARNHSIGEMTITGADLKRDLPAGSAVEITLLMDVSQKISLQVFINDHDEDFEKSFEALMSHNSVEDLRKQAQEQRERLAKATAQAHKAGTTNAIVIINQIETQQLLVQVDQLIDSATSHPDNRQTADRRIRELAAEGDKIEDALEWPTLVEKASKAYKDAEEVVNDHGKSDDRSSLAALKSQLDRAIAANDGDSLRRCEEELDSLYFRVLNEQPGFHVARFNHLETRKSDMKDSDQAEQLFRLGRKAISNNDVDSLKTVNRQLFTLLPKKPVQEGERHRNEGDTTTDGQNYMS